MSAPRHAAPLPHPHVVNVLELAGDLWFSAVTGLLFVRRMLDQVHPKLFNRVVVVAAVAIAGLLVRSFVLADMPIAAMLLVYGLALGVAIKAMGSTK